MIAPPLNRIVEHTSGSAYVETLGSARDVVRLRVNPDYNRHQIGMWFGFSTYSNSAAVAAMFLTVRFEHRGNAVGQRLAGFGGGFNPSPYFVNATKNTVIAAPGYYRSTVTGSMKMACQFIPPANAGGPEANFCSFTHTGKIDEIRADWNQILSPAVFYSPLIVQFSVVSYRN